ncbi:hypothetical protein GCM10025866_09760 [Naasia aerilata]|uniref:Acyltransferase 3 domain-containing protein n=1 Tax=Naasia aerilata TaxID=1162966 RepID=A0ABM8GA48_9MICO|nr:acyltransferase [Naasia aerilata]BDZ45067.1 hypothetical protein GCM10025866_09760 [Naasia aerilata]
MRPEIQALRAVAILAVMTNHIVPRLAPAGYIGVDVFFVVSGYLITGLLLREHARTGRIDLRAFYLRRIRRLLPAALVALTACTVLTVAFVPRRSWPEFLGEIAASLLYVQNWFMALATIDPVRSQLDSTPVVHFWSLALEEQFYLVWPCILLLALILARVLGRAGLRTVPILAAVLLLVTVPSFVYCGLKTDAAADWAYYSTFSRAWEFGAGGLMALLPLAPASSRRGSARWCPGSASR